MFNDLLRNTVVLATLVGLSSGALADPIITYNGGSFDFGVLNSSMGITITDLADPASGFSGPYSDVLSFTQGKSTGALQVVGGVDVTGDMTMQYRLTDVTSGSSGLWLGSSFAPVPQDENGGISFSNTFSGLTSSHKYSLELQGTASQATFTVALAPVPEPETWSLMVIGLGVMAAITRRRQKSAV